ncbi:hypothetical protein HX13_00355 [Chryseobacterium sp. P1-3]|uniref:Uncharacterized protein n=1 Tax=Chryseobacterium gallinarum TaxID=1324352 RepID=A0A0G3M7W1_CHRGL|nr:MULTISPECIES: hypothetical protein [Chryseobacterium]AKK73147.1 hypothetical protein OK18_11440 [Chryseobacterium gallinarum]KFF76201.1 hypothetical protein HX13_00355 [Chryseobacterium sp. P1-3]MCL8536822.1 hypothetical protein [Chryseobacterium gallinarum]QIY91066.1 hypothetical protein FOB44_10575 [Chryseobacterium gallinarum]
MISPDDFELIKTYVDSKLNDLQLSTINLCQYSHFDDRFKYGYYTEGTPSQISQMKLEKKDGKECLRMKSTSKNVGFYANVNHNFNANKELIGRTFTISFDVFPLSEIDHFNIGFSGIDHVHPTTVTNRWQRVSYSQFIDPSQFINSFPIFTLYTGDDINDFYISNLSVTEGLYPSAFYPSKEDLTLGYLSKNAKGWLDQLLPKSEAHMGSLVFPKGTPKEGLDPEVCHIAFNGNDLILTIEGNQYKLTKTQI